MKSLRKYAVLLALLSAVTVQAQTPAAPTKPLPPAEMRVRIEEIAKQIDADNRHVLHLQALARKEKDVIKLTCINDKLVQLKPQMNLFDESKLRVEALADSGDDTPRQAFNEAETAGLEVHRLRGEADGCAGELEMYKQESRAEVARPDLDDPTEGGPFYSDEQLGRPEIEPPGFASPYK